MSDDLIKALQDEAREDAEIIASFRAENIRQQDEITRLRAELAHERRIWIKAMDSVLTAELAHERRIWIKAMDSVLTKEQSYLFRDICAAAAALKETGGE